MKLLKYIVLIGTVCAAFTFQPAKADTFTSTIDNPNDAISGFTGPYAEVKIVLTSPTTATVTFTSDIVGGNIYLMGGAQGTDLNLASAATPSAFTFSQAGQTGGFQTPSEVGFSSQNVDGKGTFTLAIDYFNGFDHAFNEVTFTLTKDSGTWASAGDILTGNASGFDAAAHIFVTSFPADLNNGAINTGFAAETGGGIVTPDSGTTAMLLGLGLSGLGLVRRFVRR